MWALNNNTPFAAERCWVRDKRGAEVWLVAVRGTFLINPLGSTKLAKEQSEVCMAPEFRDDPQQSSLLYDSDLHHTKLNTDVILHGHAYAPDGAPSTQVDVRLKVSNINKTLRVFGARVWEASLMGPRMNRPEPFTEMPITYERAFGGTDQISDNPEHHDWEPHNPIGVGFATRSEHLIGKPVPNIEEPGALITSWQSRPRPAGFGPIAGHWAPRLRLAGTYDEKWEKERLPLLPQDFDQRFYQSAPADQQTDGFLRGGELVELSNLTPSGSLCFRLPRVVVGFRTEFHDNTQELHRGVLHSVIIEPDVPRVILVWHTHLPCHHKVLKLMATDIRLKQRILGLEDDLASSETWASTT